MEWMYLFMAKPRIRIDQTTVKRLVAEGRGKGTGKDYQPLLTVQDVPTNGKAHRDKGWKTDRIHHLLSTGEHDCFDILEWSLLVTDIREQYPLLSSDDTLEETLAIAREYDVDHPAIPDPDDPKKRPLIPVVMTTDFLLTLQIDGEIVEHARTFKLSKDLSSIRTLEKLEIERCYWERRGVDWAIITERDIPLVISRNVKMIHEYWHLPSHAPATDIYDIAALLTDLITKEHSHSLRHLTEVSDKQLGFIGRKRGMSLSVAFYLIATRQWRINMSIPINTDEPLAFLGADLKGIS